MFKCVYGVYSNGRKIRTQHKMYTNPDLFEEDLIYWNQSDEGMFEYKNEGCQPVKVGSKYHES